MTELVLEAPVQTPLQKPNPAEISGVENLIRTMLKKYKTPFMLIRKSVLEKQFADRKSTRLNSSHRTSII
jgi:hypothetical protein